MAGRIDRPITSDGCFEQARAPRGPIIWIVSQRTYDRFGTRTEHQITSSIEEYIIAGCLGSVVIDLVPFLGILVIGIVVPLEVRNSVVRIRFLGSEPNHPFEFETGGSHG